MNEVQIFNNAEFGKIRSVTINGEPWFVGKDIAKALGYENASKSVRDHVDLEDKVVGVQNVTPSIIDSMGRTQYPTWINESGVYALVFGSKLESAKRFKRWVTSEVLPTIRKTGSYGGQMDKLMNVETQLANTASMLIQVTTSITQSVNRLIDVVDKISNEISTTEPLNNVGKRCELGVENTDYFCMSRCKLETFPQELTAQVDEMLENMVQQQNLNFSMIARFCTVNGYSISSPSVKTYFQKHFANAK